MEQERGKIWRTVAMALCMMAMVLLVRWKLCGWLLPDGHLLESLAKKVQTGNVAQTVFAEIGEWLGDD